MHQYKYFILSAPWKLPLGPVVPQNNAGDNCDDMVKFSCLNLNGGRIHNETIKE